MVSIIIVHYKVKEELFCCINSIFSSNPKVNFEIIVVDNDEKKTIEKDLKNRYPEVKYINNPVNNGWGGGINLGAKHAKGEFLYLLNPDAILLPDAVDKLYYFAQNNNKIAVVSSLLLDEKKYPYVQGSLKLTPFRALIAYSFIHKIFPKNPFSNKFFLSNWNKREIKQVSVPTLSSALVRKEIFMKIGGFDESFFLYFEEQDLGNRIEKLGMQCYILPESKVIHQGGSSSKHISNTRKIYERSRLLYFKKYYGLLSAYLLDSFLKITKTHLFLSLILIISAFLRFYRINELMPFIGDQAWFFLSAKNLIINAQFPFIGITSSHVWLHQGPLWTYIISPILLLFNFNPLSIGYFCAFLGVYSVLLMYKTGKEIFSEKVGLISSALFATSPLVVVESRMPYHTSPIPFLTLIFFLFLHRWLKGERRYFPLLSFILGLLYNFELNTVIFLISTFLLIIFGIFKKAKWIKDVSNRKTILISLIAFIFPMTPILIYDFSHKFAQTLGFAVWIIYKLFNSVGLYSINKIQTADNPDFIFYSFMYLQRLFFGYSLSISLIILALTMMFTVYFIVRQVLKNNLQNTKIIVIFFIILSLLSYVLNRVPSEAYLAIILPGLILLIGNFLNFTFSIKYFKYLTMLFLIIITISNTLFLIMNNFLIERSYGYGPSYKLRLEIAEKIILQANGKKYNLIGDGQGSQFESYTMNYEYLTWMLGNPPVKENRTQKFIIKDSENNIYLKILKNN